MKVPFLDLKAQYLPIAEEITNAMHEVIESNAFSGGLFVARFEEKFASFCQSKYAIGVGSGTEALWLSLLALGVGPGDEVITVPNTFIATAEAISLCGAKPVFVDVDGQSHTMDTSLVEEAITPRTKAIIPVHLFGQPADMAPIMEIAQKHGLFVIEDACQAHGAEYRGKPVGSIGDLGCFSFYPGKNLGAYGEAGGIVTNNAEFNEVIRMLRDHGQTRKYSHELIGMNSRMDGLQGAVLSVKLKYLPAWNEARRRNAELYYKSLKGVEDIVTPKEMDYANHIYHVYAILAQNRQALMDALSELSISCGIHYPVPVHLQKAYSFLGIRKGAFPVTERSAKQFVSLPMFPELSKEQIEYVVAGIRKFYSVYPPATKRQEVPGRVGLFAGQL